jgi:hypothetical protein
MFSEDKVVEKRLAGRRSEMFEMLGEISKETEGDFANRLMRKLGEFEQMADEAIKSNDPLNAAMYQCLADLVYYYMKAQASDMLGQYRKYANEHRKSFDL